MRFLRRYRTMRQALRYIALSHGHYHCERVTGTFGWCPTIPAYSPDCPYGADRWCDACIARVGLEGGSFTPPESFVR